MSSYTLTNIAFSRKLVEMLHRRHTWAYAYIFSLHSNKMQPLRVSFFRAFLGSHFPLTKETARAEKPHPTLSLVLARNLNRKCANYGVQNLQMGF